MNAVYDEEYCARRNLLINKAVLVANTRHGYKESCPDDKEKFDAEWNYTYHQTMNKMAKEGGLV
jgi:hypothetical protein